MNIPLKKRYQDWIAEQVSSGRYASEVEAVEDAIAAKIEEEEVERLRARLKESIAQADRGETVPADDAFFQRLYDRIDRIAAERGKSTPAWNSRSMPKATSPKSQSTLRETTLPGRAAS